MKKIVVIFCVAMMLMSMTACGQEKQSYDSNEKSTSNNANLNVTDNNIGNEESSSSSFISKDYDFTATPAFMSKQTLTSAQKGTAMHKFLQFCNFKNARENISDEIIKLSESGLLTKSEANSLNIDSLTSFLNSSLCEKLINSDKVYKEQGFMIEVPAKTVYDDLDESFENENIIIQGFCDLCFIDNDGLHIIDYKTDRVDKDELISRYKTQLDVYALALEKTFDCKVKTKSIYSFNLKELIKL